MCKGTVSSVRERYAQTVLTFRITYVFPGSVLNDVLSDKLHSLSKVILVHVL